MKRYVPGLAPPTALEVWHLGVWLLQRCVYLSLAAGDQGWDVLQKQSAKVYHASILVPAQAKANHPKKGPGSPIARHTPPHEFIYK
jgi:hypothetical protein